MIRLLIILGLLALLYLLIRSAVRQLKEGGSRPPDLFDPKHMVQDPVCRTYVPKGSAVEERIGGHTYYFCSSECARSFQKQLSG